MNEEPEALVLILTLPRKIRLIISEYINSAARAQRLRAFELYSRYCQRLPDASRRVATARRELYEAQASQLPSALNPIAFMNLHENANNFGYTLQCIYGGGAQDPALVAEAQSKYKQVRKAEDELRARVANTGADYAAKKETHVVCLQLCVVLSRVRGNTP